MLRRTATHQQTAASHDPQQTRPVHPVTNNTPIAEKMRPRRCSTKRAAATAQRHIQNNNTKAPRFLYNPGHPARLDTAQQASRTQIQAQRIFSDTETASIRADQGPSRKAVKQASARRRRDVSPTPVNVHLTPRTDGVAAIIAGGGRKNAHNQYRQTRLETPRKK